MTKRLKVYLLIVFAAACLACTLVGCKIGRPGRAELLAGYDSHVTYYSNGGYFNDSNTITVVEIYFKAGEKGVPFFYVTGGTQGMKVERRGYDLRGWYEPARYTEEDKPEFAEVGDIKFEITYSPDADGNVSDTLVEGNIKTEPVFPLNTTDVETDRPVFARVGDDGKLRDEQILESRVTAVCDETKLVAGFDDDENEINNLKVERNDVIDVCAKWELSASISYHLIVTDETGKILSDADSNNPTYYNTLDKDGKVVAQYKNEDRLVLRPIHGESSMPRNTQPVALDGLTFVKTYMDKELTIPAQRVQRPTERNAPPVPVYCRYIVGDNWTVVTDSNGVEDMLSSIDIAERKFLVMNDIEYTGSAMILAAGGRARATIVVDGNSPLTISNLRFAPSRIRQSMTYSILGSIEKEFKITGGGLIFKDIKITLPMATYSYFFYAICTKADPAAAANMNLTIDTVTATYQLSDDSVTINYNDLSDWLFGEVDISQFTGIKLAATDNSSITKLQTED